MKKRELTFKRKERDEMKQKKEFCKSKVEIEFGASKEGLKALTKKAKFHLCDVRYEHWREGTVSSSFAWMWLPRHNSFYGIVRDIDYGPQIPIFGKIKWFFAFKKERKRLREEVVLNHVDDLTDEECGFLMQEYAKAALFRRDEAEHIRLDFQLLLGHRDSEWEELWDPKRKCWFYYWPEEKEKRWTKPAICEKCGKALEFADPKCFKCDTERSEANKKLYEEEKDIFPEQQEYNTPFDPLFIDPEELKKRPPLPPGRFPRCLLAHAPPPPPPPPFFFRLFF